jgi:hypothetical protein
MPAMPATPAHRAPVLPKHAYRLLNHGPTVLVSAAHGGQRNLMAAAWAMPLDFEPPKVAVVIDKSTFTRGLVEGSGRFALNLPCAAQADLAYTVGNTHGGPAGVGDKFAHYGIEAFEGSTPGLPLVAGCVACSRPTTCSSARWWRPRPTSACSRRAAGTSTATLGCARCTTWPAGTSCCRKTRCRAA